MNEAICYSFLTILHSVTIMLSTAGRYPARAGGVGGGGGEIL